MRASSSEINEAPMTLHHGEDGGYLVRAITAVPDDPTDYQSGPSIVGCSNLRCS